MMSGGTWDYTNLQLTDIADDLEIRSNDDDTYSEETRSLFRQISFNAKLLSECLHSADYLIAGDTDEDDFKEDIQKTVAKFNMLSTVKYIKCKCCGKMFLRKNANQFYCGLKCRRKAQNTRFQKKLKKKKK